MALRRIVEVKSTKCSNLGLVKNARKSNRAQRIIDLIYPTFNNRQGEARKKETRPVINHVWQHVRDRYKALHEGSYKTRT